MLTSKHCTDLKQIAAKFIPAEDLDDLTQEVFLYLLDLPPEKLQQLIDDKQIKYYFIRLCKNNYFSKTSRYHYKYRKPTEKWQNGVDSCKQVDIDLYIKEDADRLNAILDELYWYDRELFKLYVLGDNEGRRYTYTTLSHRTKISRMSIYTTIKRVKKYVAKRLKEQRDGI